MIATKTHRCKEGRRINGIANEKQKKSQLVKDGLGASLMRVEWTSPEMQLEGFSKLFSFN